MKKLIALILAGLMVFCLTACSTGTDDSANSAADDSTPTAETTDSAYVIANGKLVVGITDFAPMDYKDESGKWIGFDADMANKFAETLGVSVEFVEIDWDNKIMELNNKNIDCVWNGMTLTDEVKSAMETSAAYCNNAQVVIVKKDVADKYKTAEACKELNFAVESGSAGKDVAAENGFNYIEVQNQAAALMEVESGTADAAIIDLLMAGAMVGEGTSYTDLTYTVSLNSEEYGVGFRKGSDLAAKLNNFFKDSIKDGTTLEIAKKYGVQEAIIR